MRWASGDSIDLFFIDYEHDEFKDNNGFILAGAATLTMAATGVALLSAVLM
jgi:hypothetical protein